MCAVIHQKSKYLAVDRFGFIIRICMYSIISISFRVFIIISSVRMVLKNASTPTLFNIYDVNLQEKNTVTRRSFSITMALWLSKLPRYIFSLLGMEMWWRGTEAPRRENQIKFCFFSLVCVWKKKWQAFLCAINRRTDCHNLNMLVGGTQHKIISLLCSFNLIYEAFEDRQQGK